MIIYKVELQYYVIKDEQIEDMTGVDLGYFMTKESARKRLLSKVTELLNDYTSDGLVRDVTVKNEDDSFMLIFDLHRDCNRVYVIHIEEIEPEIYL